MKNIKIKGRLQNNLEILILSFHLSFLFLIFGRHFCDSSSRRVFGIWNFV